jgi:gliding motility associated protien GldN
MTTFLKKFCFLSIVFSILAASAAFAQPNKTESGKDATESPRDGAYDRYLYKEKKIITYDFLHEKDVFWEKRVWRVIDVNEKMNHPFRNGKKGYSFIEILLKHARENDIQVYNAGDDEFKDPFSAESQKNIGVTHDTIEVFDPETFVVTLTPVVNEFNAETVKKFRLKEVWFFDEETSTMGVRILGVAPIVRRTNDNGDVLFEGPMFWAYYPELREVLARHEAFNEANEAMRMSWEDIFENRHFASYITKESNVYDRRIQDYKSGLDGLLEAEKIKDGIFHFEHDLWEY